MTTAAAFPHLFAPLQLGHVTLKNRIFSSGHDTVMSDEHGRVTDQLIAYHEARAAGGAGMIVMQVAGVHETARYTSHLLMVTDDDCIPGYRRLAEAVHAHGTALVSQIFHPGREIMESADGTLPLALAPSAVPSERFHVTPQAVSVETLREIIRGYAEGALRLQQAGLDGVEVVASHGYLPAQFLNPQQNLRDDEYGGSLDGRMRMLRETVAAVRAAVGREFVVGVRLSFQERSPDETSVEETLALCEALDADGNLDYLNVTEGTSATASGSNHIVAPMHYAGAYTAPSAAAIKRRVSLPVLVAGRINQPQDAEALIARGDADACAMTRALICDPEMPSKANDGEAEAIRACIGCNQACIGHFHRGYPISCIQRPETGRELQFGRLVPAPEAKHVMVIGGGPAGMKTAVVAARRGHRVTLCEGKPRLGGQALLAERLPHRAEFGGLVTNLLSELDRFGVEVRTRTHVDTATVREIAPDLIVAATGANPYLPPLELDEAMPVYTAWEVIDTAGECLPKGRIVIADSRGDWIGLGVAEMIARTSGREATLAVLDYAAGQTLQQYTRNAMVGAANAAGVKVVPNARLFGADEDTVYLQHTLNEEPILLEDVAALVIAHGNLQEDALLHELRAAGYQVRAVGDCQSPRSAEEAVLDGLRVGAAL